ncbi:MAG: hypothetical protein ACRDU0_07200, partial [Mycobacterium sp.]
IVITAAAVSLTGNGTEAYAQIGHGGFDSGASGRVLDTGTIFLSETGALTMAGGANADAYAQIGDGGDSAIANGTGLNITVLVSAGGGSMTGGAAPRAYVQIGDGGDGGGSGAGLTLAGNVGVGITGALTMNGNASDYAQIGDGAAHTFTGVVTGNVDARATDTLHLAGTVPTDVLIGSFVTTGVYDGPTLIIAKAIDENGASVSGTTTSLTAPLFHMITQDLSTGTVVSGLISGGHVTVITTGTDLQESKLNIPFTYNSSNSLDLISQDNVTIALGDNVNNTGALLNGAFNLSSGWDGTTGLAVIPGTAPFSIAAVDAGTDGVNFGLPAGPISGQHYIELNATISTAGGAITFAGPVRLSLVNDTLTSNDNGASGGKVAFFGPLDNGSGAADNLTIQAGGGPIVITGPTGTSGAGGSPNKLGTLTLFGGNMMFGPPTNKMFVHQLNITTTGAVTGEVDPDLFNWTGLGGSSATLTGTVGGAFGQQAASNIKVLQQIGPGPCTIDGFSFCGSFVPFFPVPGNLDLPQSGNGADDAANGVFYGQDNKEPYSVQPYTASFNLLYEPAMGPNGPGGAPPPYNYVESCLENMRYCP